MRKSEYSCARAIHCRIRQNQSGFTLVELLVVIAIIGILVALLLPSIQAAREASRRVHCQNNMKQIALACLNYHEVNGRFPAGSQWDRELDTKEYGSTNHLNPNWIILTLPHLEQQMLYDTFDLRVSIADPVNEISRSTRLESLLCPTDVNHSTPFDGSRAKQDQGANWARGNYAANSENAALGAAVRWDWAGAGAWFDPQRRGVMGTNNGSKISEITDGTSNTMLFAEVRAGLVAEDVRGTWALGGPGSSLYWHGWHEGSQGSANGPNDCSVNSDDLPRCFEITVGMGGYHNLVHECMACKLSIGSEVQVGVRSMHPGGASIALCDGSVHWISNDIETSRLCCSAWDRLILSQSGEVGDRGF